MRTQHGLCDTCRMYRCGICHKKGRREGAPGRDPVLASLHPVLIILSLPHIIGQRTETTSRVIHRHCLETHGGTIAECARCLAHVLVGGGYANAAVRTHTLPDRIGSGSSVYCGACMVQVGWRYCSTHGWTDNFTGPRRHHGLLVRHCGQCDTPLIPYEGYATRGGSDAPYGPLAIRNYSDRTASDLGPFGPGPTRYGIELEVEGRSGIDLNERAIHVIRTLGADFAICKRDGSLIDGFEIVTAPADRDTHAERWARLITPGTPGIPGLRSWGSPRCGLHIHQSRAGLSRLTIAKLAAFINNVPRDLISRLVGREPNRYCGRSPVTRSFQVRQSGGDRYRALNLLPINTIEYRLFKGTLSYEGIMRDVEFVQALTEWVQTEGPARLASYSEAWSPFVAFIARTPKRWPFLSLYLQSDGQLRRRVRPGAEPPSGTNDGLEAAKSRERYDPTTDPVPAPVYAETRPVEAPAPGRDAAWAALPRLADLDRDAARTTLRRLQELEVPVARPVFTTFRAATRVWNPSLGTWTWANTTSDSPLLDTGTTLPDPDPDPEPNF